MTNETVSAVVGGLVGAVVGAVSTAFVTGHQKHSENSERQIVIAAQLAREIGFALLTLLDIRKQAPGSVRPLLEAGIPLKWSGRISEWAGIFSSSTVALVSDFSTYVDDTKSIHAQCIKHFVHNHGASNWIPFTATLEKAIITGVAAHRVLSGIGSASVRTPKLTEAELEKIEADLLAKLNREQR